MSENLRPAGRSIYSFLERVLPAATLLFSALIIAVAESPFLAALLCLVHVVVNVALSKWISRLPPAKRLSMEHPKNAFNLVYVGGVILWLGPGSLFWVLHFLPILRGMVTFPSRGPRLITALVLGGSASLAEYLADTVGGLVLEPLVLLFTPALITEVLFRFFGEELLRESQQRLEIEQSHRLSSRMEAVGNLAAGLAHEINTPVQYVGDSLVFVREGIVDLLGLIRRFDSLLDPSITSNRELRSLQQALRAEKAAIDTNYLSRQLPSALDRALEGLERVAQLVRSVRRISHPGTDRPQREDLNVAVRSTVTVASSAWREVAEVRMELEPLPEILCNIGELNQVILNLLVNAADAIRAQEKPDKGLIDVRTFHDEDTVTLIVADDGEGISPEVLDRVFDPFFTTKDAGQGTGQGLAITQSVVERQHGGSIAISSQPGRGTTVRIVLPIDGKEER